jgi:hypothetical protein
LGSRSKTKTNGDKSKKKKKKKVIVNMDDDLGGIKLINFVFIFINKNIRTYLGI